MITEYIDLVEAELSKLIISGHVGAKNVWFGEIEGAILQTPTVYFILNSRDRGDAQVAQDNKRMAWDLNYSVYCLYSGIEGRQKFINARNYVDSIYNLLQTQHSANERLGGNCFDIGCISVDYGQVAIDRPEETVLTGGVIELVIQIIEIF